MASAVAGVMNLLLRSSGRRASLVWLAGSGLAEENFPLLAQRTTLTLGLFLARRNITLSERCVPPPSGISCSFRQKTLWRNFSSHRVLSARRKPKGLLDH